MPHVTTVTPTDLTNTQPPAKGSMPSTDPRARMAERLPRWMQPFLTWLTAKPVPQAESERRRAGSRYVWHAFAWSIAGLAVGFWSMTSNASFSYLVLPVALIGVSSGLGIFQAVIFHHCAHATVFVSRSLNVFVGRLLSSVLFFKSFDSYRSLHLYHHNPQKFLTEEDEFADFVFGLCGLQSGLPKSELWRRLWLNAVFSPTFHMKFFIRRLKSSWNFEKPIFSIAGIALWLASFIVAFTVGYLAEFIVLWVFPVTVLLQIATLGRILCEHRISEPSAFSGLSHKHIICETTIAVFPGSMPPLEKANSFHGVLSWTGWWLNMLTVQLFNRVFVLVGDAPCHDFHHRHPGSREWAQAVYSRERDGREGCPGFPAGYSEVWGLFRAIDLNFAALDRMPIDSSLPHTLSQSEYVRV